MTSQGGGRDGSSLRREVASAEAVRLGAGKWPAEVLEGRGPVCTVDDHMKHERRYWVPDLSLIRGEWYFSPETSQEIAHMVHGHVLLAGTPTVAELLPTSTLVESSPWAAERLRLKAVRHFEMDFEDFWTDEQFDSVVLDPPWYFPALTNWINNAAIFSRVGAKIIFPLFGAGTRPTAALDRERILHECKRVGEVELHGSVVKYEVPKFEYQALASSGINIISPWRYSDLVVLTVKTRPDNLLGIRQRLNWLDWRYRTSIVSVCMGPIDSPPYSGDSPLHNVPGVSNWTLNAVSRRDPRWKYINVWMSDNRVAFSPQPLRLANAIKCLSLGLQVADADQEYTNQVASWIVGEKL